MICALLAALAMRFRTIDRVTDWSRAVQDFNLNGVMALMVLVPFAATIFAVRRYREVLSVRTELARLSLHDSLTGLPNRRYLNEWLAADIKASQTGLHQTAVLFVDLDKFKLINDTYGHEVGDKLMAAVAQRITDQLRPGDRIVRYGGDEFVIICADVPTSQTAERVAARLIEELEAPFRLGGDSMRISASIGVALAEHNDVKPEEVLRDADVAMYRAKARGSGNYTVFDRSMTGTLTPASAEEQIRAALDGGEFRLYYQPVVDLVSGRIVGAEALIRWATSDRGLTSPADFIPILEETGLIVPVGTWVLGEACRQARSLADRFPDHPPLKITVNVSARQLAQVDFRDIITRTLAESGVAHGQICLEITEGALMYDVASAWAVLRHAKALGVQLALDDFGTGYSSLSYVRKFSLDMLKIDKSFIDDVVTSKEDRAIVDHVIGMAKALGMTTVAEGVEHPEQLIELQKLGCELAQGYAMSKPLPVEEFVAFLEHRLNEPFQFHEPGQTPAHVAAALAAPKGSPPLRHIEHRPPGPPVNGYGETNPFARQPEPEPVEAAAAPAASGPASAGDLPLPRLREYRPKGDAVSPG
ncbi:MAG: hypothetical protein JWM05_1229 [Acidimicrobiales bacterium]|nr:hypothetical protein [Acidimicrobiales bacterium]